MKRLSDHRIRGAAALARPGMVWAAAIVMNAPAVAAAAVLGWFAFTSYEAALQAVAGVLFALALLWVAIVTADAWQVLRRFARRHGAAHRE